jgi:hypothetical protein
MHNSLKNDLYSAIEPKAQAPFGSIAPKAGDALHQLRFS